MEVKIGKKIDFHFYKYEAIYLNASVTYDHEYIYIYSSRKILKGFHNMYNLYDEREIPVNSSIIYLFLALFYL